MQRMTHQMKDELIAEMRDLLDRAYAENDRLRAQHTSDVRRVFTAYAEAAAEAKRIAKSEQRTTRVVRHGNGFEVLA